MSILMKEIGGKMFLAREGNVFELVNNNNPCDCNKHELIFATQDAADKYASAVEKATVGYGLNTNIVVPLAKEMGASVKEYNRYYTVGMLQMTDWRQVG